MVKNSDTAWKGQYFRNIINGNQKADKNLLNPNTPLNQGTIERRLIGTSVCYLITIKGSEFLWDYENPVSDKDLTNPDYKDKNPYRPE